MFVDAETELEWRPKSKGTQFDETQPRLNDIIQWPLGTWGAKMIQDFD